MANPFEDQDAPFVALENGFGERALWPAFLELPTGWRILAGPGARSEMLAVIEAGGVAGDEAPGRRAA